MGVCVVKEGLYDEWGCVCSKSEACLMRGCACVVREARMMSGICVQRGEGMYDEWGYVCSE